MQRKRSARESFPEQIDLNQGSFPNNPSMDSSASGDPVLNQVPNYILVPNDVNISRDHGESSSRTNNLHDGARSNDSRMRLGWSSSSNASPIPDARSDDWTFQPSNINATGKSPSMQSYTSNHGHMREQLPTFYTSSSSNIGASSGSSTTFLENNDVPGPSFGNWGPSSKRKALEGSPGHFYPGGSSSSNPHVPGYLSTTSSSPSMPLNLSLTNSLGQMNSSSGAGMSRAAPAVFPSSTVPRITESSDRSFTRSNPRRHEPVPSDTPPSRSTSMRSFHSRPIPNTDSSSSSSQLRSHQFTLPTNQPHLALGSHSYSRGGSSSGSEVYTRSSRRSNNMEYHPVTISAPEIGDVFEDQTDWTFGPGAASVPSRNRSSGPWLGGNNSSGGPHQYPTLLNHQRLSEAAAPWIPVPRVESNPGIVRRSQLVLPPPSASLSLDELAAASRAPRQLDQRSAALLMDMPGDDAIDRRALAAIEGRHRLIRQVLSSMRRGVHLSAEEYMMIDPLMNGFAELHDRHRDMRLDVDNMSYEELLALEERIGDVSTGLSEEKIKGSMKKRKFEAISVSQKLEPCSICQEDYITGDDIGILDCGHEFHPDCIKQWLNMKNLCPICKMPALET